MPQYRSGSVSDEHAVKSTRVRAFRPRPRARSDFVALAKPRLNLLVVASALAGYVMASGDTRDVWRLLCMIVGTASSPAARRRSTRSSSASPTR